MSNDQENRMHWGGQGIAEGALEEFGTASDGVQLLPFAEPGACVLRLQGTS